MHIAYYTLEHDAHSNKSTTVVYVAIIPLEVPKSCGKGWDAHLGLSAGREHVCMSLDQPTHPGARPALTQLWNELRSWNKLRWVGSYLIE